MSESVPTVVATVSNAMVALHKAQFGRGPTSARTHFAGPDALICVLDDALLPAERSLVAMGEALRVQESRMFLQEATRDRFVRTVEQIVYRKVRSFSSACDAHTATVVEVFVFEPLQPNDAPADAG